jgi:hypothetical protein
MGSVPGDTGFFNAMVNREHEFPADILGRLGNGCVANFLGCRKVLEAGHDYAASAANCCAAVRPLEPNCPFRIM